MGDNPIDPMNEYTLHDVVNEEMPEPEVTEDGYVDHPQTEFYGLMVRYLGDGDYIIHYDGHADYIGRFEGDKYDDVLTLVGDLVDHLFEIEAATDEELVEYAGRIITTDKERAEEDPDLYLHIPEDSPARGVPDDA